MDAFDDRIYSIVNGKIKLLAEGKYGAEDNSHVELDENNLPIYRYY